MSLDGKNYFIGCSGYQDGDKAHGHRFIGIRPDVDEKLVVGLLKNKGQFKHGQQHGNLVAGAGGCASVLSPRSAAKIKYGCGKLAIIYFCHSY